MLTLRFTRVSPTHHRLDIVRTNGSSESVELDSKSFLHHDFLHYAVESQARLAHSFFGRLAAGSSYADLTAQGASLEGELLTTERVVGPLTTLMQGRMEIAAFRAGIENMYQALGEPAPAWVTDAFVSAVAVRYRALTGQWNATPFGQPMELKFQL